MVRGTVEDVGEVFERLLIPCDCFLVLRAFRLEIGNANHGCSSIVASLYVIGRILQGSIARTDRIRVAANA